MKTLTSANKKVAHTYDGHLTDNSKKFEKFIVGKKFYNNNGFKKHWDWLVSCSGKSCKETIPLHSVLISKKRMCFLCSQFTKYGLIKKYKTSKHKIKDICSTEYRVKKSGERYLVGYIKCAEELCRNKFTISTVSRYGHTRCLSCRTSHKKVLGVVCRSPAIWKRRKYITKAVAATDTGWWPQWYIRCRGRGADAAGCSNDVLVKKKTKPIKDYRCFSCAKFGSRKPKHQIAYYRLCAAAKLRKIKNLLTFGQFCALSQSSSCFYCRKTLVRVKNYRDTYGYFLDRLDNAKGYEWTNVVPCCSFCNRAKAHLLTPKQMLIFASILLGRIDRAVRANSLSDKKVQALAVWFVKINCRKSAGKAPRTQQAIRNPEAG